MLTLIGEFTTECPAIRISRRLRIDVLADLFILAVSRGHPV
ncbi:hypothetical protein [Poseidonocella sp. HB161398]|nr:hypothetical protein [Poseidonocella sp. HB161398]